MRERILEAIYQKIEENPEDENLQKQINLLGKASICTIHSFCLDVIKNNFYEIDTSANFRIAEGAEIELLKQEVLEDIFEKKYLEEDKEFLNLIDTYTNYQSDDPLKDLILKIYRYIQASPFPEAWLKEKIEMFTKKEEIDFAKTIWGQVILQAFSEDLQDAIVSLKSAKKKLENISEMQKFYQTICCDLDKLELISRHLEKWDEIYQLANDLQFDKWPIDRKAPMDLKEEAKEIRDRVKKNISVSIEKYFIFTSKQALEDIFFMYQTLNSLEKIVLEFSQEFRKRKKEKNMIDFNDIEHFALDILVKKNKDGTISRTEVARKYQEKFEEIAIDEYQDSNLVQEYILSSISNGHNIFMVGDVKQSIYKFRQARPELFLEKYETYKLKEEKKEKDDLKIQLFKNFRSRKNVLDVTNLIFDNIMSRKLGDIHYDIQEYLNLGADFPEIEENKKGVSSAEVHILDVSEKEEEHIWNQEEQEEIKQEEPIENAVLEAKFVANKVQEILDSKIVIWDKKQGYRPVTYKDIVILLRSTSTLAPIYEKELNHKNFPVFSDTGLEYLDTVEIQTIMSLLKIIDNPVWDIPLVTVLRSSIGGFSDNELIQIRLVNQKVDFYEAMLEYIAVNKDKLAEKIKNFLKMLETFRNEQEYLPLDQLIWKIYMDTGYYHYVSLMPNGALRQANLKMLFERAKQYEKASFKGVYNFINFIDKLKQSSNDLGAAKLIGENDNVIRIMSIHKSKGLEFPIVFVSSMGKNFNMQDLNDPVLLHQELGLGPKVIDSKRRIEYTTLAREAIKIKTKIESLSEEMRVLYVATTRAKEKLIMTGVSKDAKKEMEEKEKLTQVYEKKQGKLSDILLKKYKSYLDWIELVYLSNQKKIQEENIFSLTIHDRKELLSLLEEEEQKETEDILKQIEDKTINEEEIEELKETLDWEYPFKASILIPSKTSVTQLKELKKQEKIETEKYSKLDTIPKFLQNELEVSPARKGTLMHLCIQKLNEKEEYTLEKLKEMTEMLQAKAIITELEKKAINIPKLYEYTKSHLWKELKEAKQIEKEKPFYINLSAKELNPNNPDEMVLVQGVIDLYYISKQDELILVDYKTDFVKEENELILKYQEQLKIYQRALEKALNRKVNHIYLYSVYLNKEIEIPG